MSHAATAPAFRSEDRLDFVKGCLDLFAILFSELFGEASQRFLARGFCSKASGFLRGVEGLLRRVLVIRAAALVPGLPPAAPPKPRTPRAKRERAAPDPLDPKTSHVSFCVFNGRRRTQHTRRAAGPRQPAAVLVDSRPLRRRFHGIMRTIEQIDGVVLRLARRLRGHVDRREQVAVVGRPRLYPEHECYMAYRLDVYREDANDVLRALQPDSS